MRFTLEIELGNEVMRTPDDVASALEDIAQTLCAHDLEYEHVEGIRDANGNTVGTWTVIDR